MPKACCGRLQACLTFFFYFTLYFTLARGILLGWEIDFKSLSSLPKILLNSTSPPPGSLPSLPSVKPVSHSHIPRPYAGAHMQAHTHTALHHTGHFIFPNPTYKCTFITNSISGSKGNVKRSDPEYGRSWRRCGFPFLPKGNELALGTNTTRPISISSRNRLVRGMGIQRSP